MPPSWVYRTKIGRSQVQFRTHFGAIFEPLGGGQLATDFPKLVGGQGVLDPMDRFLNNTWAQEVGGPQKSGRTFSRNFFKKVESNFGTYGVKVRRLTARPRKAE